MEKSSITSVNMGTLERKRELRLAAASQGMSVSAFIRQLFEAYCQYQAEGEQ